MKEKPNINDPSLLVQRFDSSGRVVAVYARAKGLQETALRRVFDGTSNGKRAKKDGATRKIFCHLKKDEIWIGELPWEQTSNKEVT